MNDTMSQTLKEIADFIAECANDLAADIQEGAMPEEYGRLSNYGHWHATLLNVRARIMHLEHELEIADEAYRKLRGKYVTLDNNGGYGWDI